VVTGLAVPFTIRWAQHHHRANRSPVASPAVDQSS
jgi:hypothetical protein